MPRQQAVATAGLPNNPLQVLAAVAAGCSVKCFKSARECYAAGCRHAKWHPATCTAAAQQGSCLLQAPAPITAITFLSDSQRLVVATAINQIGVFDVPARQAAAWTKTHSAALPLRLLQMPGLITHLSANPNPRVRPQASLALHCFSLAPACLPSGCTCSTAACANSRRIAEILLLTLSIGRGAMQISALLAATPSCICHINLDKPLPPAGQDLAPQTPALAGRKGRRQRKQKRHQMQDSKPGENFRVWRMSEPCLALTYTAPSAALMVRGKLACSVCAMQALHCSLGFSLMHT